MKFSQEIVSQANHINSYDDDHITVRACDKNDLQRIDSSLLLTQDQIITDWQPQKLTQLSHSEIAYLKELDPEVVIFAPGSNHDAISAELLIAFSENSIGVEYMPIGAACRTFNLLIAEGRRVALVIRFHN